PLSCCSVTEHYYAQMLKTAVDAIKAADPNAKIVCMGGLSDTVIDRVLGELSRLYGPSWVSAHCDVYATHDYPDGVDPSKLTRFIDGGMPVWNTETGLSSLGAFVGAY